MDFRFDLFKTTPDSFAVFDAVQKLWKQSYFISVQLSQVAAEKTAESFYPEIFRQHGFPRKIIFARDSHLKSSFWTELKKFFQICLSFSSASSLQMGERSERAFRIIKEILRCLGKLGQKEWDSSLPRLFLHIKFIQMQHQQIHHSS